MQLSGFGHRRIALLLAFLALFSVFAVAAAACGGDDDDDSRSSRSDRDNRDRTRRSNDDVETRAPDDEDTPTPDRNKDSDGDTIADADDACPDEADEGQWTGVIDGCPDTLEDLLNFSYDEVNAFWADIFEINGVDYFPPDQFLLYGDQGGESACGLLDPNNAFYCLPDHSIYFHGPFMESVLEERGDFAVAFIVAHEWGHLVQGLTGILQQAEFSIDVELQADCFAGVWTADADSKNILEEGDFEEGILILFDVRDPDNVLDFEEGAHGTGGQRIDAFQRGFNRGLESCFDDLKIPSNQGHMEN